MSWGERDFEQVRENLKRIQDAEGRAPRKRCVGKNGGPGCGAYLDEMHKHGCGHSGRVVSSECAWLALSPDPEDYICGIGHNGVVAEYQDFYWDGKTL